MFFIVFGVDWPWMPLNPCLALPFICFCWTLASSWMSLGFQWLVTFLPWGLRCRADFVIWWGFWGGCRRWYRGRARWGFKPIGTSGTICCCCWRRCWGCWSWSSSGILVCQGLPLGGLLAWCQIFQTSSAALNYYIVGRISIVILVQMSLLFRRYFLLIIGEWDLPHKIANSCKIRANEGFI
jgi:hypothetical protein